MEVLGMPIGKCPSSCELWNFWALPLNSMTHFSHKKATRSSTQPQHRNAKWPYNLSSETLHPNLKSPSTQIWMTLTIEVRGIPTPTPTSNPQIRLRLAWIAPLAWTQGFVLRLEGAIKPTYWSFEVGLKLGWECLWPQYMLSSYWDIGLLRLGDWDLNLCYHPILTHWGWGRA